MPLRELYNIVLIWHARNVLIRQAALAAMMMELSHSLTLNEEALQQIPAAKRPLFIFEWLRFLDKVLVAAQKSDIKGCQQKLVTQLTGLLAEGGGGGPGPPTRRLLARCLATLFSVGDTFLLFDTVNKCNDILKSKDDSPSYLPTRLAAISCVGCMYEKLGRMMGRSYEETVHILIRSLRSAESQTRIEIMNTLEKVCCGMGSAISNVHKEIYKAAKQCLTDRSMPVRCAAANCLLSMIEYAPFLYTTELENMAALCFRAFDGSTYEVRCSVAELLGTLMAATQAGELTGPLLKGASNQAQQKSSKGGVSLEEALSILMGGFLRGGSSFLKGEIIKAGSGVNREIRVGVTHVYVIFIQNMGGLWLERNLTTLLIHVLDLVANPKAASSHVDAVYSRKCINFILRSVLGKMLGEKAQASACKEIVQIIVKQMNSIDFNPENAKDFNQETLFSQHLLVCGLIEIGNLMSGLGTAAQNLLTDQSLNIVEAISAVLVHPCHAARLGAAWCLRCICVAVPTHITPLIDRCVDAIENMRTSPEAISGYSAALAAVLGAVRLSPLGVPHNRGKVIFNTAEELLRSASQNSRLSLNRTHAGWLLIGAIMTLGVPVVRGLLPRMLLLWRNSFPRSNKELESEKARGDSFTWQVTLEGRAGALSALHSLLLHCPTLATDDVTRRLTQPVESALAMLTNIQSVLRQHGQRLKAAAAQVRFRLYSCLSLLPPAPEPCHAALLRALVAELALADSAANTATSGLGGRSQDTAALGIERTQDTDHADVEDQLLSSLSASGSGALEHDPCCLYQPLPAGQYCPGPLPLGVAVIDMSVVLFGLIFPRVANKHRLQMLDHFTECIRLAKSTRQEAIQTNVFAALLGGLRGLAEAKGALGGEDVKKSASTLIISGLSSSSPLVRCLSGQCAGRLAQLQGGPASGSDGAEALASSFISQLRAGRAASQRSGLCMALGALYRARGGIMGGAQHYGGALPVLLALAQDQASSHVQVWSLHALSLIADAGGPMFRGFVEPTLTMALNLLLLVPPSQEDVHRCIGKLLSALITTIGPELQGNTASICTARSMFLCACAIMQEVGAPSVQAEAIGCLQQLHLFAPRHLNLSTLVPTLCRNLSSKHLVLRRAAISCLRQLSQREAKEVCQHALSLVGEQNTNPLHSTTITESGLPGTLFAMLDTETDGMVVRYTHDTLTSMVQVLSAGQLSQWLSLCKAVLTVQQETTDESPLGDLDTEVEGDDDQAEFHADQQVVTHPPIQPRWPTRVFAMECVQRIMTACESAGEAHFDLLLAKEQQLTRNNVDYLVLHLADLIRMSFMAATSESDPLRLSGLRSLCIIITRYCRVPEPEFPGHLLLEQFQAQVGAALRPAFSPDTPSHVTSAACEVCSTWIGSGVARDLNDLRRVHQLLVSSLHKLNTKLNNTAQLYNESLATLEKLAILKAWAEVYIVAMISNGSAPGSAIKQLEDVPSGANATQREFERSFSNADSPTQEEPSPLKGLQNDDFGNFEFKGESLLKLVEPELENLAQNWYAALRDHALLSLPPEYGSQLPHDGGAFYTADTVEGARGHYHDVWPALLHATALHFNKQTRENDWNENPSEIEPDNSVKPKTDNNNSDSLDADDEKFHLLFGICMEALCTSRDTSHQNAVTCLLSLTTLFDTASNRARLLKDRSLAIELCHVLHRIGLTQEGAQPLLLAAEVLQLTITAAREDLDLRMKDKIKDLSSDDTDCNNPPTSILETVQLLGEGGPTGDLPPGKSLLFSCLEVCLCLLVRQLPCLSPGKPCVGGLPGTVKGIGQHGPRLLIKVLGCMSHLTGLGSPHGAVAILPTILYLTTGVIKETGQQGNVQIGPINACMELLTAMGKDKHSHYPDTEEQWGSLMQSVLAKIIDLAKNDEEDIKLDVTVTMQAMSAILPYAPPTQMLHFPCINHFRVCLQSNDPKVVLRCSQILGCLWSLGPSWARSLAPPLLRALRSAPNTEAPTPLHTRATQAMLAAAEALLPITPDNSRVQMLCLIVPILISYLKEAEELQSCSQHCRTLHDYSLQWLMKVGPKYQQEFKTLMSQSSELRAKLENAIKANQQATNNQTNKNLRSSANGQQNKPAKPSIQLKTDFSNFS